jgi:hypothetical protein
MTPEQTVEDAMSMVRQCAAPAEGLSIKAQIRNAARALGWPYSRTRKVWYGEAAVRGYEWRQLESRAQKLRYTASEMERVQHEISEIRARTFPQADGEGNRGEL